MTRRALSVGPYAVTRQPRWPAHHQERAGGVCSEERRVRRRDAARHQVRPGNDPRSRGDGTWVFHHHQRHALHPWIHNQRPPAHLCRRAAALRRSRARSRRRGVR